jgi:ATP phosphoribosyltransferase regulatory subunit
MIHHPPAGARDLLPLEVVQKAWINDRLQEVFQRWGYQRIVTSTLESLDTLVAGGAIDPATVVQLQSLTEGPLGLRPELTASIARATVTRITETHHPQRLCYRANVFRQAPQGYYGRQMEFFQAGVELLYIGGVRADAEILLLLAHSLENLGLTDWQLILGDAGLTRTLLERLPADLQPSVKDCIAHLDYVRLQSLDYPSATHRDWALQLFDLRGEPSIILDKLEALDLVGSSGARVKNLRELVNLIQTEPPQCGNLILDLSWLQPFDYYTGIVFQSVSQGQVLGQGGRYDQLLSLYHPQHLPLAGVGFSLNLEELHHCLLPSAQLPQTPPFNDCLVIPETPQAEKAALHYARLLRQKEPQLRVELALENATAARWQTYGQERQIRQLLWVKEDGTVISETLDP